jgi:transcriptional regulator with XRE-family HTH domain
VPKTDVPTLRRWELGARLRSLRLDHQLSVEDAAERLLCSPSKISRLETGARGASQRDVRDLCDLYEVTTDVRQELMTLARPTHVDAYWKGVDEARPDQSTYVELETAASSIQCYETIRVPGLLQTAEYTREMISAIEPGLSARTVEQLVKTRQLRQRVLDQDQPPRLWCIVDEAAFHRQVGGPKEMVSQIRHVIEISRRPNVTVQIVGFSGGAHGGCDGVFTILEFPKESLGPVVYVEGRSGGLFFNAEPKITTYRDTFDLLRANAASPPETRNRLEEIAHMMLDSDSSGPTER